MGADLGEVSSEAGNACFLSAIQYSFGLQVTKHADG